MPRTGSPALRKAASGSGIIFMKARPAECRKSQHTTSKKIFVYDVFGQMAAEYSIGAQSLPCTTCYIATDYLGSEVKRMGTLTTDQAYRAMLHFLELYYNSTHDDGVGALLGGMAILEDGKPADPALWAEWLKVISSITTMYRRPQE